MKGRGKRSTRLLRIGAARMKTSVHADQSAIPSCFCQSRRTINMSAVEEAFEQSQYEMYMESNRLSKMSDTALLEFIIKQGSKLNNITEHFPTYDVALKLKINHWKPTEKQRKALINTTAYYLGFWEAAG
jgi:hypothetical protein